MHIMSTAKQSDKDVFLKSLGQRMRSLRLAKEWTIEGLADRAGLSPRFVSQIEAGRGNVSVARLSEIAHALEEPIQNIIPAARNDISLRGRIWELLENCNAKDLEELHEWLSVRQKKRPERSIALVGLRGAGKSTIGKQLASHLGLEFVEFDGLIEREAGVSLPAIFSIHGEDYYRKLERAAMERFLSKSHRAVLATGGSLVTAPETWAMVRRECHTAWLKARPKDHWDRVVAQGDMRPIVNHPGAMDEMRALLKAREPLYAQADMTIDTSHHTIDESVDLILKRLEASARRDNRPALETRTASRSKKESRQD
jgi:XRE family aerobic/anaerobic benzoate catabolism transcriptional regulator